MNIITKGHDDRYSVEQITSLFFIPDDNADISSELAGTTVVTKAKYQGKKAEASSEITDKTEKGFKNAVKKSAYLALKELSDRSTPWGILTGIRPTKFVRLLHESMNYIDIKRLLTEEYWVSPEKADFCITVCKNSEHIVSGIEKNHAGLYIGVPFCPSRCIYCSFISESAALYQKLIPEYVKALKKELSEIACVAKEKKININSVYIGGGTPPTLGTRLLSEVIEMTKLEFGISDGVEFTVEAGRPDVIDDELLSMLKSQSVNRICINPQTMNDDTLRLIGRNHTSYQTEKAFELARSHGFDNINSDIIAGLPGENGEIFDETLRRLSLLEPEEITVHTMYLKRASRLSKEKLWDKCGTDTDKMLSSAYQFAQASGYKPYYMYKQRSTLGNLENCGYAKSGSESLYNIGIMEEVQTIFAAGAGASTKICLDGNVERIYNIKDALSYTKDIDAVISKKISELFRIFGKHA